MLEFSYIEYKVKRYLNVWMRLSLFIRNKNIEEEMVWSLR